MGHVRLGRLPKRWRWPQVFEGTGPTLTPEPAAVATGIAAAAAKDLDQLREQPDVIGFRVWLISSLGEAARGEDFAQSLWKLDVPEAALTSSVSLIAAVTRVRPAARFPLEHSIFDAIATSSLREALVGHLSLRTESLFESPAHALREQCAELSNPRVFASVTRHFLSAFSSRLIRYVADKEISNSVGPGSPLRDSGDLQQFEQRLDAYCSDTSRIVEDFAEGWFAKSRYQQNLTISTDAANRFAALALRKLQMEFKGLGAAS